MVLGSSWLFIIVNDGFDVSCGFWWYLFLFFSYCWFLVVYFLDFFVTCFSCSWRFLVVFNVFW